MKKSVLAIALAVLMTVSLLTVGAMAGAVEMDFGEFLTAVEESGYNYDGNGVTVRWSPSSACTDNRHESDTTGCRFDGAVRPSADGNTPQRGQIPNAQYQIFNGQEDVSISNVNFVFEAADWTLCANSGWGGVFTAEQTKNAELQLLNSGDVTFESCTFDAVIASPFNSTTTSTFIGCTFKNVYDAYAIKDVHSANLYVSGCEFEHCGGAIYLEGSTPKNVISIIDNIFTDIDTYAEANKVNTRGLIQFSAAGDYSSAKVDISGNTSTGEAAVLRQLNNTVTESVVDEEAIKAANSFDDSAPMFTSGSVAPIKNTTVFVDALGGDDTSGDGSEENPFKTIEAAINSANTGDTIKLASDYNGNVEVEAGKNIILDLNGFNITNVGSSNTITVELGAKLEIVGNGIVDNTEHGRAAIWNDGTVTLSGGTYTRSQENGQDANNNGGNSYYTILNHGTMTVNSGVTVENNGKYSSMFENGWQNGAQNTSGKDSVLTINGGTFIGGLNTIKNDDYGILVINDGTFENAIQSTVMNWNKTTINGGEFTVIGASGNAVVNTYADADMDMGSLTINGGTFSCAGPLVGIGKGYNAGGTISITNGKFDFTGDLLISTSEADVAVSGGDFSVSVSDYVAEGFEYELENGSGRFSYYKTYAEALEAADNGSTISKISEDGSLSTNYTVKLVYGNGEVNFVQTLPVGSEFILPSVNNSGYIFLGWRCGGVTYKAGETVTVNSDMTFTAVWGNLPDVDPEEPTEPEVPDFPFYDVNVRDWYYDAVYYVWEKGLMDGVDTHEFAPNATLTRAMVWTIIARAEGVDTTGGNSWYAKAQEWVVAKGISDGENPSAAITRQELVTMLYRLAGEPTVSGSVTAPDASSVSAWASDAMVWAMNIGLIEGDENGAVTPTATATRAQAAAIFMRYIEA